MDTYTYPTNAELMEIAQDKLPVLTQDDPIFEILPMRDVNASEVQWDQMDNYVGLQQIRGHDGDPPRVKRVGAKRFRQEPGVYGEFLRVDETELTKRRPLGQWTGAIDITDLIMELQDQLLDRRLSLLKFIGWQLVMTGAFSIADGKGDVLHAGSYSPQTYDAAVDWSTALTATPLQDFRNIQQLSRGHSVSFGAGAVAYMNRPTFNKLIANINPADLYGRRTSGLSTVLSLNDANNLLMGEDLPMIRIHDDGYLDQITGNFVPFIGDDLVAVVGRRPGNQRVGEYQMTRNANNPNMGPGAYQKTIDRGETTVPRTIEVHDGHNGGPALMYPSAIVIMDTTGES